MNIPSHQGGKDGQQWEASMHRPHRRPKGAELTAETHSRTAEVPSMGFSFCPVSLII